MNPLPYLKRAGEYASLDRGAYTDTARITLVSNFTDDVLRKLLIGIALSEDIYPELNAVPYKQYHFELEDETSPLSRSAPDLTWFFFDVNPYVSSEFTEDAAHFERVLDGIERYVKEHAGLVAISTFPLPYDNPYGNLFAEDPLYARVAAANERIERIGATHPHVTLLDTNRLLARMGTAASRDLRSSLAFDVPFTNAFFGVAAMDAMWRLFALRGRNKKCIVLDLDNTLWGGIVGEEGARGIALGPGYPGYAYREFQRVLKRYAERGILLAVASKNNPGDVDEVFSTNSDMVLRKDDFAAIEVGWGSKAEAIERIARNLNIGLESIVFIDDDAANREEVKSRLAMVTVPELPAQPESYAAFLLALPYFTQLTLTTEDRERNAMYVAERKRKTMAASDPLEYLEQLGVEIRVSVNDESLLPRLAQLTQKTNQFNLTTKRYSEEDLRARIRSGSRLYAGEVRDRFGSYGTVVLALVDRGADGPVIDSLLMSCRVMGRGVAEGFLDYVIRNEHPGPLYTAYRKTPKNEPVREFLPSMGFASEGGTDDEMAYTLETSGYETQRSPAIARILERITISPS